MSRVLILGAGYAGLLAANRLARDPEHQVTLVNERPVFVHRIRLHELTAGSATSVSRPLSTMLHPRARVVVDRVTAIEPGSVGTASGRHLTADHVVLAVGSGAGGGPATLEGALAVGSQVRRLSAGDTVTVSGAGLTGVEMAAELAEARPELRVELVDPAGLLPSLAEAHRAAAGRALTRLGVTLPTVAPVGASPVAAAGRVSPASAEQAPVTTGPTRPVPTLRAAILAEEPVPGRTATGEGAVIDCHGLRVPSLTRDCGLDVDAAGRVRVAPDLSVPGRSGLWAVGDCAAIDGMPWVRMSCAAALPMGEHLADSVARAAAGRPTRPFDFGYVLQCLSLGRRQGLLLRVDRHDTPTGLMVAGRGGALAKAGIVWYAGELPRWAGMGSLWGKVAA